MCATVCCSNHIRFFQNLKTGLFKDFQESLDLGKDEVERSTTLFQELCFQHQHVQFNQNVASCYVFFQSLAAPAVDLVPNVLVTPFLWTPPVRPRGGFWELGKPVSPYT